MQLLITLHNVLSYIFIVLVTQGKVSVSLSTLSPSFSTVETVNISSDWKQVRNESRRFGIYNFCKLHFNAGRDICNKTVLEEELTPESSDFYLENCHCDDDCVRFGDCCIDKVASFAFKLSNYNPTSPSQPWSCVDLPISLHGLYAFKQCKPSFRSSEIEHLCISEPKSFLQWLPAYSSSSGIFYRNLFCAFCNSDHDSLHNWNLTITCDHNTSMLDITPYINEKHFNYSTGLWEFIGPDLSSDQYNGVFIDNKWRCKPSLPELEQYDSRSKFGTRSCQPVIDSCSTDWTDPIVASKCSAYTFLVGLPSSKIIYRNTFCARCNYVPKATLRYLDCDLSKMAGPARSPTSFTYVSLRQLFDVSAYSSCSLTQYQIYNPASQSCMTVRCDVNYTVNPETGRCESITRDKDGTTLRSDCLRIFFESSDYTLNSDGSILLKEHSTKLEHGLYQNFTQIDSAIGTKIEGILTCYDEQRLHYSSPMYSNYIQGALSIITSALSILGLTAYLTVTCLVPKLRNLRTRMLMSLSGSLLAANLALICGYLSRPALNQTDDNIVPNTRGSLFCVITAINIHYWYLASFAWMNVMAYDAWKSFKRTHERLSNSMVHFLKYSLYSWLLPATVVLISVSFDLSNIPFDYRPMYGHRICWISQRKSLLAFFVAPFSAIIVINVIFFSLTTWFLYRTKQSTRMVVNSKSQENSQRYSLYVRLATLMGLTWIFWFFAAFSGINLLWYLFIILNGLQGAFIFFYFTCKKEVFKALQERIGFLIHGHEVVSGSSSSRATRSASLLPQPSSTTLQ